MFSLTWLLFLLGNKATNNMSSRNKMAEWRKQHGEDKGRNRTRQRQLYEEYLGSRIRGEKDNRSYLSDYDLYLQAQEQLRREGYVWEPDWDPYIPSKYDR